MDRINWIFRVTPVMGNNGVSRGDAEAKRTESLVSRTLKRSEILFSEGLFARRIQEPEFFVQKLK